VISRGRGRAVRHEREIESPAPFSGLPPPNPLGSLPRPLHVSSPNDQVRWPTCPGKETARYQVVRELGQIRVFVDHLAVKAAFRRPGVATRLMGEVESWARSKSATRLRSKRMRIATCLSPSTRRLAVSVPRSGMRGPLRVKPLRRARGEAHDTGLHRTAVSAWLRTSWATGLGPLATRRSPACPPSASVARGGSSSGWCIISARATSPALHRLPEGGIQS